MDAATLLQPLDTFPRRHIGPDAAEQRQMLDLLGLKDLDDLSARVIPDSIREAPFLDAGSMPNGRGESELLAELKAMAQKNQVLRSYLGMGYHGTHTPGVILRNILENPGWYTAYTPYQAEIAQGRLELLLCFQHMVTDLTGMDISNASLLDEATAAAEAVALCDRVKSRKNKATAFFVDQRCHPQTLAVVQTRAQAAGVDILVGDPRSFDFSTPVFGLLVQYPATDGEVVDYRDLAARCHDNDALVVFAADLLSLALLTPPGELGADVVIGCSQRFGVPMGFGGPHAAFMATRDEYKRSVPGRIIGVSQDRHGNPALRMALQTREQHIRRQKATSNICTAQVLLAVIAAAYAIYHGPEGVLAIARRVHGLTALLAAELEARGLQVVHQHYFDTLRVRGDWVGPALAAGFNLRAYQGDTCISLDETVTETDLRELLAVFDATLTVSSVSSAIPDSLVRTSSFLTHERFTVIHSEHGMLRLLHKLQARDLALDTSMIALGSCTMKLNATSQMIPVTWPEFGQLHPFAPAEQTRGYAELFEQLEGWLCAITGFDAFSLQPNAGSQGEYAGLLAIRGYHQGRGDGHRDVCLIPTSAHGTNPASAVMVGMRVVAVRCDDHGNIDLDDLSAQAQKHADRLAALMVTYPSTHGVFETAIRHICEVVHQHGGQVYLDGANMNAQVGLCRPGHYGADVCHLNLHKTFAIPHGGGGPGMGPIGVKAHLAPYLPGHPKGAVSAAPYGSPSILPISWMYIASLGADGLRRSTQAAILNANYVAKRLEGHYDVLYTGPGGWVAHECILDTRPLKKHGVEVDDIAKRLMDYGFHAPTMSFPVVGTLMVEPTESEPKAELDRFCDALIAIRNEARAIDSGELDPEDNPLKNAPHTAAEVAGEWSHPYSRDQAAFPAPWTRDHKYWPAVGRIDNAWGDRHLICTCPSVEELSS